MKKTQKKQYAESKGEKNLTDAPGREGAGSKGSAEQGGIEFVGTYPADAQKFDFNGHKVKD